MHERTGSHGAADRAALPTDSALAHDRPQLDGHRGTHAHLWMLPDGTGLHAPYGQLVRDPHTGQVCCHLCGEWFRLLGSHLRRHGISADDYRHEMGLCRTRALASAEVSQAISRRQAQAYRRSAEVRERLAVGNQLAQFGQLAWRARRARDKEQLDPVNMLEKNLAFNLAGHVNHTVFWPNMSPDGGQRPDGELASAIDEHFGSFDAFAAHFTASALGIQGSGWSILAWDSLGQQPLICQLYDHQANLALGLAPLLMLDMWEHAFYLQYRNVKADYVDAWWNVVNWADVAKRFDSARTQTSGLVVP